MAKNDKTPSEDKNGVMVIGGGVAGIQASLDLANLGIKTYLVEKKPAIGGVMAQLDKTFPTNDCSICILSPKLREVDREIFRMCMLDGLVYKQAAAQLGLTHGSVRNRLSRLRRQLRIALSAGIEEPQ